MKEKLTPDIYEMEDVERTLAEIGVPIVTRHNEVARCQYEFAHLYATLTELATRTRFYSLADSGGHNFLKTSKKQKRNIYILDFLVLCCACIFKISQPSDSYRNRTSPVAFTGDKFEFRVPCSSQSITLHVTMFAALWTWGLDQLMNKMEAKNRNRQGRFRGSFRCCERSY